jgi:hypothetical protein
MIIHTGKLPVVLVLSALCVLWIISASFILLGSNQCDAGLCSDDKNVEKVAAVGIMSVPHKISRRELIRSTYLKLKPTDIDVFFVMCKPDQDMEEFIKKESEIRQDIVIMNCTENMNEGKTFTWFSYAHNHFKSRYSFVFKGDDDAYLNLENLHKDLIKTPKENVYYGRLCEGGVFMAGMLYGFTKDVVQFIATDPFVKENIVGGEDQLSAHWVQHKGNVQYIEKSEEMYDHYRSGAFWQKPFHRNTIAIHQCKAEVDFYECFEYFYKNK